MTDEKAIRDLFHGLVRAHREHDAAAIAGAYAPDAVIYDLAPPLGRRGMDLDHVAAWLATWDGPIDVEARDESLMVSGGVAVATAFTRFRGRQGGKDQNLWFRSTLCLERRGEGWRIVHEHSSVPFAMDGSERALLTLTP